MNARDDDVDASNAPNRPGAPPGSREADEAEGASEAAGASGSREADGSPATGAAAVPRPRQGDPRQGGAWQVGARQGDPRQGGARQGVADPGPVPGSNPDPGPDRALASDPARDPDAAPAAADAPAEDVLAESPVGVAALSPRYRAGAVLALAVVAVVVCAHLGMVFLHVAPANTVSKQHAQAVDDWIYPEFEQNWKLFAPNPLQQNIAVQARAEVRGEDGGSRTTDWYDLSAEDGRAILGNPLPSHTQQNELRRAFDYYTSTHDKESRPVGLRGALAEQYLRRIVEMRLDRDRAAGPGGALGRVQVRSRTTSVSPPVWSGERASTAPFYHLLPWWTVPAAEAPGGVR
ncbi:DUF5819 family protein [Streptomyces sp. NPDC046985]|uniref:DUF5819 family protein n=1 Tax=Streptomyces sp. NPDC046985 TaxID=3155377 RepID=UPI0033D0001B